METDTKNSFLPRLQAIVTDRGNRASLRRYWSPATRHQAYPLLGQLGALRDDRKTILAALYAEHPEHQNGQTVGKAALRLGDRKEGDHPYDRHFRRLLACDSLDDLALQLHRLVRRLQRKGIGLDYTELQKNLNFWVNYREDVKVRWAADFWQAPVSQISMETTDV
ncbi:MAG: CRISPR type I-E-associated protein CasB/Cse2 [Bacteroidia bacterium]|jgi:CRISPR type I-E-associated protein CasB/Cse2